MPGRTLAIGDIHGSDVALNTLLAELTISPDDTVVVLGDAVDRGPGSRQVVDRLLQLSQQCRLVFILGNHEQMLLDFIDNSDMSWLHPSNGGAKTLSQYGSPMDAVDGFSNLRIPAHHIDYFRSSIMVSQLLSRSVERIARPPPFGGDFTTCLSF